MTLSEILKMFWPLLLIQLALMVASLVDLRKRQKVRYLSKPAWVLVCIFLNTLGPVLYFLVGRGEE
ncbi:MAG: PLDc_N domain-containing protein [Candidatus Fermentithermobacillus carboniphilus]|uniref:PLDc_N domain-containing protein n=1 Tax=Candidatus Fermentithermobacillus carboniphilus TaxID=3085328 RepID=A0AAT9LFG2_9FIRM|nr:MAG: PLDc_N domain-containing protein [Candidatus Fermentithermobacillus carboniphilus]